MKLCSILALTAVAANEYIIPAKQIKTQTHQDCQQICNLVNDCHVWTWFEEAIPLLFHGICLIKEKWFFFEKFFFEILSKSWNFFKG